MTALPLDLVVLILSFSPRLVFSIGESCLVSGNRLDPLTARFLSACDFTEYCVSNKGSNDYSTCQERRCRSDTWPPNWPKALALPPKCPAGSFCPDEGSGCLPLLAPGHSCQLNRDDQCRSAPPLDARNLSAFAGPRNSNGAVCLRNVCTWANASIGSPCAVDNQAYYAFTQPGEEFLDVVSRDNCAPGGWCDATSLQCKPLSSKGGSCVANKACASYNCLASGVCGPDLTRPLKPSVAGSVLVGILIPLALGLFAFLMVQLDLRHRRREASKSLKPDRPNGRPPPSEEVVPLATLSPLARPGMVSEDTGDSKAIMRASSSVMRSAEEVHAL